MATTLKRAGYTLVELLVAMAIGALLLTAVLGAFLSSSRLMSWIGTRTDVASSALLGLNSLAADVRSSAFRTMTVTSTPALAVAFLTEDSSTTTINDFVPATYFTIYYYLPASQLFMRKTWSGTQPGSLLPDPFQAQQLLPGQLAAVLAQTNGTEHRIASNVVSASCTPGTYPTPTLVNGLQVTLAVSATAPNGQTCVETVSTMVCPRNHP